MGASAATPAPRPLSSMTLSILNCPTAGLSQPGCEAAADGGSISLWCWGQRSGVRGGEQGLRLVTKTGPAFQGLRGLCPESSGQPRKGLRPERADSIAWVCGLLPPQFGEWAALELGASWSSQDDSERYWSLLSLNLFVCFQDLQAAPESS